MHLLLGSRLFGLRLFGLRLPAAFALALAVAVSVDFLPGAQAQTLGDLGAAGAINAELEGDRSRQIAKDSEGLRGDGNRQQAAGGAATQGQAVQGGKSFAQKAKDTQFRLVPLLKLLGLSLLVVMWIRAGDWVNQDCQIYRLGWYKWNHILYVPFGLVAIGLFFSPLAMVIKLSILFVVFLATWVPYVLVHNKNVQPHQTVLTGAWWRHVFAMVAGAIGIKVSADRVADYEKGVSVELLAMGADDANADNANLLSARNSPGYLLVKEVVAELVDRRCDRVMFDFTKQAVSVRHEIDGMWHNGEAREREASDVMLAVMKTLANLDVKDRRKKQEGQFGAKYGGGQLFLLDGKPGRINRRAGYYLAVGQKTAFHDLCRTGHARRATREVGRADGLGSRVVDSFDHARRWPDDDHRRLAGRDRSTDARFCLDRRSRTSRA